MQLTATGRLLDPGGDLQPCDTIDDPATRSPNFDESELPEKDRAQLTVGEPAIYFSSRAATEAARIFARFVRSKLQIASALQLPEKAGAGHINS